MKVHQIMTAHARSVSPDNMLVEAAGLMRQLDVGALPVCADGKVMGMITDRDIVIRATADGRDPNGTSVADVMTSSVVTVYADQEVEDAARAMQQHEVRRLPVLDRGHRLVGTLSLGDVAVSSNPAFSGLTLREVSQPKRAGARDRKREALGRSATGLSPAGRNGIEPPGEPGRSTRRQGKTGSRGRTGRKTTGRRQSSGATRSSPAGARRRPQSTAGAKHEARR